MLFPLSFLPSLTSFLHPLLNKQFIPPVSDTLIGAWNERATIVAPASRDQSSKEGEKQVNK